MAPKNNTIEPTTDREIVSSRVFDATRERVFEAFSNPKHVMHWWGPNGFTNTIHEFDLRVGGRWRLSMHAPNGTRYDNESEFVEIVKPERVVYNHLEPIHRFQMQMNFAEEGGKTRLTWRMIFESAEEVAKLKNFIADANEQNFDRLAKHLANIR